MSIGFSLMSLFLMVVVIAFVGIVIGVITKGILRRSKGGMSSEASVYVTVISRRTEDAGGGTPKYFATFELESGQRMELELRRTDYDTLDENQIGKLKHNGIRFNSFKKMEG